MGPPGRHDGPVAYRHGLRVSELVDLRWDQIEFASGDASRAPGEAGHAEHPPSSGTSCAHCGGFNASRSPSHPSCSLRSAAPPLAPPGSLAWSSEQGPRPNFPSRRTRTCSGTPADALANKGHDTRALQAYLGHRNIQHTVRYTNYRQPDSRSSGGLAEPTGFWPAMYFWRLSTATRQQFNFGGSLIGFENIFHFRSVLRNFCRWLTSVLIAYGGDAAKRDAFSSNWLFHSSTAMRMIWISLNFSPSLAEAPSCPNWNQIRNKLLATEMQGWRAEDKLRAAKELEERAAGRLEKIFSCFRGTSVKSRRWEHISRLDDVGRRIDTTPISQMSMRLRIETARTT